MTLEPRATILGRIYGYSYLCGEGIKFGEYIQTNEKTANTMTPRKVSVICPRSTEKSQEFLLL